MSIIISHPDTKAQKIDKSEFAKEGYLQEYIHKNPESIPVYEIEEDKKLFVVAREFPTDSGSIDALAIDKDGDLYVIETKLFRNADKMTQRNERCYNKDSKRITEDYADLITGLTRLN